MAPLSGMSSPLSFHGSQMSWKIIFALSSGEFIKRAEGAQLAFSNNREHNMHPSLYTYLHFPFKIASLQWNSWSGVLCSSNRDLKGGSTMYEILIELQKIWIYASGHHKLLSLFSIILAFNLSIFQSNPNWSWFHFCIQKCSTNALMCTQESSGSTTAYGIKHNFQSHP